VVNDIVCRRLSSAQIVFTRAVAAACSQIDQEKLDAEFQPVASKISRKEPRRILDAFRTAVLLAWLVCLLWRSISTALVVCPYPLPQGHQIVDAANLEAGMSRGRVLEVVGLPDGDMHLLSRCAHVEPRECVALQMRNRPRRETERVAVELARKLKRGRRDDEVDVVDARDHGKYV
jgi:hypothetical protein